MADAIEVYYQAYHKLPKYDDMGPDRQRFIQIFVAIYATRHHQKIANDNSPGSMGLKDESMLDTDIIAALGDLHKESKNFAKLNKPELSTLDQAYKVLFSISMVIGYPFRILFEACCSRSGLVRYTGLSSDEEGNHSLIDKSVSPSDGNLTLKNK
jgi:hypothetical protein